MPTSRLQRKRILRRMLSECGYTDDLIAEDFPVWSPRRPVAVPDLVTFVHPDQRTMATAAIIAPVAESEREVLDLWLSAASAIAAPAALIALPDRVSLWSIGAEVSNSHRVADTPLEPTASLPTAWHHLSLKQYSGSKQLGFSRHSSPSTSLSWNARVENQGAFSHGWLRMQ
jgi:hypothetical protein